MRAWRRSKLGRPSASRATISPSRITPPRAELPGQLAHLRIARREVREVAALERDVAVVEERDRADPVPLDLEAPLALVARQFAGAGQHRLDPVRHRLVARVLRRVHAVQQPVLAARGEERVAALEALAVEGRDDLVRRGTSRPRRCRSPRPPSSRRRTRPSGSRPRSRGIRAGGPRCGRRAGSRPGGRGSRAAAPRRRARRRAPASGPSAGCARCAPGRRSGPLSPPVSPPPRGSAVFRSRAWRGSPRVALPSPSGVSPTRPQLLDRLEHRQPRRPRAARPPRSRRCSTATVSIPARPAASQSHVESPTITASPAAGLLHRGLHEVRARASSPPRRSESVQASTSSRASSRSR